MSVRGFISGRAKKRIAGLKVTATYMDWSHGSGPEVAGPAEALVIMMAGRLVALNDLSGEGKAALVTRRSVHEVVVGHGLPCPSPGAVYRVS